MTESLSNGNDTKKPMELSKKFLLAGVTMVALAIPALPAQSRDLPHPISNATTQEAPKTNESMEKLGDFVMVFDSSKDVVTITNPFGIKSSYPVSHSLPGYEPKTISNAGVDYKDLVNDNAYTKGTNDGLPMDYEGGAYFVNGRVLLVDKNGKEIDVAAHGIPYSSTDKNRDHLADTIIRKKELGLSHGCFRMYEKDMKELIKRLLEVKAHNDEMDRGVTVAPAIVNGKTFNMNSKISTHVSIK